MVVLVDCYRIVTFVSYISRKRNTENITLLAQVVILQNVKFSFVECCIKSLFEWLFISQHVLLSILQLPRKAKFSSSCFAKLHQSDPALFT